MKLRRIIEFVVGVLIALFLIRKYNDTSGSKYLIDFIMPYQPFKAIFVVVLIIISSNLIAGKPKDYSGFFYTLLVKLFANPFKKDRNSK